MSEFKPTKAMRLAKSRLYKHLSENKGVSLEDMTIEAMQTAAKARNLSNWLSEDGFSLWWYEKSTAMVKVAAGVEIAIERLLDIVNTPAADIGPKASVSTKDILAAADKLFQLADLYPKKRIEKVFLDKQLNAMDAEEVGAETKALESKLKLADKKP